MPVANISPTILLKGRSPCSYTMTFETICSVLVMKLHCPDNKWIQTVTLVPTETPAYLLFAGIIAAYTVSRQFDLWTSQAWKHRFNLFLATTMLLLATFLAYFFLSSYAFTHWMLKGSLDFGFVRAVGGYLLKLLQKRQGHHFSSFTHLLQEAALLLVVLAVWNIWPERKM